MVTLIFFYVLFCMLKLFYMKYITFLKDFVYLFIYLFGRERVCMEGGVEGDREEGGVRISSSVPAEHGARSRAPSQAPEIMT